MIFKPSFCKTLRTAGGKPWAFAWSFIAYFFALPVHCALTLQNHIHWQKGAESVLESEQIARLLQKLFGLANIPTLCVTTAGSLMVAWAFFAYLNDKKQVDFYHSLPISRGRLFFSRSAAALLSLWSAYALNLLLALLVAWIMGMAPLMQGLPVLTGLANHLLFSLALFFTAALATELTGIQAISTALTLFFLGVFPSFIWIIRKLASCFYPNFYGELYDWQTPLFWSSPLARYIQAAKENQLLATDYLWIGAGTALLAAAALALHLRRPSEAAGRAVTFRWAEPLLKYIVALWAALGLAALLQETGGATLAGLPYGWLLFGCLIGGVLACQTFEIVLQGDFKAYKRHLRGLAVFCLCLAAAIGVNIFDVAGFNRFTPTLEQTAQVEIRLDGVASYVYEDYIINVAQDDFSMRSSTPEELRKELAQGPLTTEEEIAAAISIQKKLMAAEQAQKNQDPDQDEDANQAAYRQVFGCYLLYTFKDGSQTARKYVNVTLPLADIAQELDVIYSSRNFLDGQYLLFQQNPQNVRLESIYSFVDYRYNQWKDDPQFLRWQAEKLSPLLTAFETELKNLTPEYMRRNQPIGTLSFRSYIQDIDGDANLEQLNSQAYVYYCYPLYPCFEQTLAALADLGYDNMIWQDRPEDIRRIIHYQTDDDGNETETVYDTSEDIARILNESAVSDVAQYNSFMELDYRQYYIVKYLDQDRYDTTRYGLLNPPEDNQPASNAPEANY